MNESSAAVGEPQTREAKFQPAPSTAIAVGRPRERSHCTAVGRPPTSQEVTERWTDRYEAQPSGMAVANRL